MERQFFCYHFVKLYYHFVQFDTEKPPETAVSEDFVIVECLKENYLTDYWLFGFDPFLRSRYWVGVRPKVFLKARVKLGVSLYAQRVAISEMFSSG